MPLIVVILILIFILLMLAFLVTFFTEEAGKKAVVSGLDSVLFLVLMPKQSNKKEGETPKEEKVLISQMEQIFANFLSLQPKGIFGKAPTIALEIASQTGGEDISFYVCVPKSLESVFEKYVQGVYEKAIIQKVPEDYTVFEPQGQTAGAFLKLKENFLFPISTYQTLEKDPLAPITNNLSKISATEGAAVQLIITPVSSINIKTKGESAMQKIREGMPVRKAAKQTGGGIFADFFAEVMKSPPKPDDTLKGKDKGYDQAGYEAIQKKIQKQVFATNIRIIASAQTSERAKEILSHLTSSFSQFSISALNSLEPKNVGGANLKKFIFDFSFRNFNQRQTNILNIEELASIYHFPTHFTETPYIKSVKSVEA